jgi:hypothetical protein
MHSYKHREKHFEPRRFEASYVFAAFVFQPFSKKYAHNHNKKHIHKDALNIYKNSIAIPPLALPRSG